MNTERTFQKMVQSFADIDIQTWIYILEHDFINGKSLKSNYRKHLKYLCGQPVLL